MTCPRTAEWDLLAMETLADEPAQALLAHARLCPTCRELYAAARRDHTDRVRMYEAFDRDHDEQREQLMAALPAEAPYRSPVDPLVRGWYRLGDYAMSLGKTTGRQTAALVVPAAAVILIALFLISPGQKSAFAAAIEHLKRVHTIVCRVSMPEGIEMHGVKIRGEGRLQISDQFGSCSEMSVNGLLVTRHYAPVHGPMIAVQPITKTWIEVDTSQMAMLDVHEQSPDAFLLALRKLTADAGQEIGRETIDGRAAIGYRVPGEKLGFQSSRGAAADAAYAELWIDVETRLPLRFLLHTRPGPGGQPFQMAYDQFQWDVPLEASAFEPNLPADYTKIDAKLALPTETALINALRRIGDLTNGRYPTALDGVSVLTQLHGMIPPENFTKFDELGTAGVTQLGLEIGSGAMFYMKLVRDGCEPEYFGDEVTAADADQVLVRWKQDDGRMRVIYGDLHAETLPAEQ